MLVRACLRRLPAYVDGQPQTGRVPSITALVEPSLLFWARKSANLEPLAAARKIGIPEGRVEDRARSKSLVRRGVWVTRR